MSYIGKEPIVGNFQKCDAITTSSTATYNLTVSSVAVFPETTNNCIVSLNGVIQAPTSAYTISGSQIVFASSLTSSDVIDFILILGSVLSVGTPTDNTVSTAKIVDVNVTTAKIADDAITLAKMASGTDGQIITYDASGNPTAVGPGSDGQVLTSTGAGSPPAFEAAVGGAWTHIKTVTASSDSAVTMIHGTSDVVFDATYSTYALVITNLKPATDGTHLYLRYVQGGSVISTNKYGFFTNGGGSNQGVFYSNADNQTEFKLNGQSGYVITSDAEGSLDGIVYFSNPASTAVRKNIWWQISWQGAIANTQGRTGGGGFVDNTTANNGFSVLMNSGNIASGKFKLYGITS
tara:strand:- start:292 stop:1338 length:1047 start_codon:yes stop_codon:yes gene_type:complete